ncbi:glycosyltransferase family 4 protein [Mariniflexile sp.]|uniref:glycosyltransferase family 4 protein n=1 Tax=Mariniflexile sp. TaxID=1979402 RepID=UPI004047FB0C
MKIAINCSFYFPKGGGIKEYIFNLVINLNEILKKQDSVICYISKDQEKYWVETMPSNIIYKLTPFTSKQPIKRSLLESFFWLKEEKKEQFDVFHSPFFHAPKLKRIPIILTVHDMRFKKYPETYGFLRLKYLEYAVVKSVKTSKSIIAISNFTKGELMSEYNINENKITVIHEAVNKENFNINSVKFTQKLKDKGIKKDNYLLCVGHVEPRKNYERLIIAFDKLVDKKNIDKKLVIVGKENFKVEPTMKLINQSDNVVYLGWVDFGELLWLYQNCLFHVFPSYYEGFGFPILEAAIFSKMTVGSNAASIPEIAGDGGIYFDPFSINSIYNNLVNVIEDESLLNEKIEKTRKNLNNYSWNKNAQKTYELYKSIIEK